MSNHLDATSGRGNLRQAVRLPPGEDLNEWLAVHTVDFFNQVNILYGTLTEFCTKETCPVMSAGPRFRYKWVDSVKFKKPIACSAPRYIKYVMDGIETQLDDDNFFPQQMGVPFPQQFIYMVKVIFARLFRGYAHIYNHHFDKVVSLNEEAHFNTCFKHFVLFTGEYKLIEKKNLAPLGEMVDRILIGGAAGAAV